MWVVPTTGHLVRYNDEDGDNDLHNDDTDRDAESVSRHSLKGNMVELPGNSLSTLNINMIIMMLLLMMMMMVMMSTLPTALVGYF